MLINCFAFRDGHKEADLQPEHVSTWQAKPGGFVGVALRDATDTQLAQMQHKFGLHERALEDARHGHQRPKLEEYGGTLFVVLQRLEPDQGTVQIGEVAIFVGANCVVAVRSNGSADAVRDASGTAIRVNLSMVTIEESETAQRQAAWAACFGVSTALAVITTAASLLYWRLRRAGWL